MCVVAIAWQAHPRWRLVVAGNRDEFHARASAPLAHWDDGSGIIAGRDLVSGGSWMGVSDAGRFAVVTNIRNAEGPNPDMLSRGVLVADWLAEARLADDLDRFNPFNLIALDADGLQYLSNRPEPLRQPMGSGIHGLSNAISNEHWPRKERLMQAMADWLERVPDNPERLLEILGEEAIPDRDAHPVFIRSPAYGTRCSTVLVVDHDGHGEIVERRFGHQGVSTGQSALRFRWPAPIAVK